MRLFTYFRAQLFISVFAALMLIASSASAGEKYVLDIPVPEGLSAGMLSKMFKDVATVISKRLNVQFEVNEIKYIRGLDDDVFSKMVKNLKDGKAQMSLIPSPIQYSKNKTQVGDMMIPILSLTLNNKPKLDLCTYVRKDTGYKSILDLKGKVWGGTMTAPVRYALSLKGVNTPLKDFFGKTVYVDETNVAVPFEALIAKKIDVFVTPSYLFAMSKGANAKFASEIKQLDCNEFEHVWFFTYKKGMPKDIVDNVVKIMVNSAKDKDFAQYKFMLSALKGKFEEFDGDMKTTDKIAVLYKKGNWEKEQTDFIKANKK